jgi:hypothetical protein
MNEKRVKLGGKLHGLLESRNVNLRPPVETPNFVVNLSDEVFTDSQMMMLNKGLKHKVIQKFPPIEEIVADIECGLRKSGLNEADRISARVECKQVIDSFDSRSVHPRFNKMEMKILKEIKEKPVFVMKPDKGKGVVVMNKWDYEERMKKTLNEGPYEEMRIDGRWKDGSPLHKMEMEVLSLLKELKEKRGLNQFTYKSLIVSNPKMPIMHGLPKIHKEGDKMRAIIASIKTPTYKISKYVVKKFEELNYPRGFAIKNSFEFVDKVKDLKLGDDEIMVSFDVVGLFPNIPLNAAFESIDRFLKTTSLDNNELEILMRLSELCMNQNVFQFRDKFYKQRSGAAIGNCASPMVSEFFMSSLEETMKNELWFPRIWIRYVDDVFAVVKKDDADNILERINSFYPSIQFTTELEVNRSIAFLDLKVTVNNENGIEFDIFRKPTDSQLCIRSDSFHHQSHQHAALHSMFHRMFNIPLSPENFNKELNFIRATARINGFEEKSLNRIFKKHERKTLLGNVTNLGNALGDEEMKSFIGIPYYGSLTENLKRKLKKYGITVGFKNPGKICDILGSAKDKVQDEAKKSGVYLLECDDCDAKYVGLTKRRIGTRKAEHVADCGKPLNPESAMAFHCITENHEMKSGVKLLKEVDEPYKLSVWESLKLFQMKNENLTNLYKEGNSPSILYEALI